MNAEKQWSALVLLVVLLTVLSAHGQYELTVSADDDADSTTYVDTGTKKEIGGAGASSSTGGYASCSADAYTWAKGDSASLYKESWGAVRYDWEWTSAPGSAPGGSLYWENDGDGAASADGRAETGSGSANCSSSAYSETAAYPPSSSSTMTGEAWGSLTYGSNGNGDTTLTGGAQDSNPTESSGFNSYEYGVSWNGLDYGTATIAAGTTNFSAQGGAICTCDSDSYSSSTVETDADASASASVYVYVSFTSN